MTLEDKNKWFINVSKRHTKKELVHIDSQWDARVDVENTITENSDQLCREKFYGQCLVDNSFIVPTSIYSA